MQFDVIVYGGFVLPALLFARVSLGVITEIKRM